MLAALASQLEYSAGAVIINKNSKDDENFYLIHDGEVKLTELTSELTEPTSDVRAESLYR
eukprot:6189177-Pleurochrysis_carterae.AAC.3